MRDGQRLARLLPLAILLGLVPPAWTPAGGSAAASDTLPLRLTVAGGALSPGIGRLCRLQVSGSFNYAGGQRFVLRGIADAEQHFFVIADPTGTIRQLYWLQAEEFLPSQPGGYDYSADSAVTLGGLPWSASLRTVSGPPQPGSDRTAAVGFLTRHGLRFPMLAPRLRLTYVPEPHGRREFMIVYLEATAVAEGDSGFRAILGRATSTLRIQACP